MEEDQQKRIFANHGEALDCAREIAEDPDLSPFRLTATDRRLSDYSSLGKDGLTVTLGRSKTDQAGAGRKIGIPYGSNPETYPVRTLQAWLVEQARITAGHLRRYGIFQHRSPKTARCERLG